MVPGIANGDRETYSSCIAVSELMTNDNQITDGGPNNPIFSFKEGMRDIKPKQTMFLLPISLFSDDETGALPHIAKHRNLYKQIRFCIKYVKLANLSTQKIYTKTLYSNWIDISGEDFTSVAK